MGRNIPDEDEKEKWHGMVEVAMTASVSVGAERCVACR